MFFRNLTFFRYPPTLDLSDLDAALAEHALKPIGPQELSVRGWVKLSAALEGDALPYVVGDDVAVLTLGGEDKILPAASVNAELAKRLQQIEEREGRRPGGRARKRIKEDVVQEMLPRALTKPYRLTGYLDRSRGLLVVDTASRKAAEGFVTALRYALGSFPALPLNAEVAPRSVLTAWVAGEPLPDGLALGDECELRDAADRGAVVKCRRQELRSEEVERHLEAGKQVTRLAIALDDRVAAVLGEDLVLRKFRVLDGAVDSLESMEREDLAAEFDARLTLMALEVRRLFDTLSGALRFSAT